MRSVTRRYWIIMFAVSAILTILRLLYVVYYDTDLHTEEAQYWLWSKHPDFSYYSKPPLIAYANYFSTAVYGDTELGIRINAIAVGFILPFLLYFITTRITGNTKAGFISVMVLIGMPFYHYISIFFTTDSLLILFWLLTLLFAWHAINHDKWIYWILTGMFLGLGFLSKYTMVLFVPFLILYLYIYGRSLLKKPGLYITLVTGFLFSLPVVIWNVQNDFYGLKHILGLSGVSKQGLTAETAILNISEYLGGQILILSPFFVPSIVRAFTLKLKVFNRQHANVFRYLKLSVLFIWIFFLPVAVNKTEVNWLLFVYPAIPVMIAINYSYFGKIRKVIIPSLLSMAFILLFLVPVIFDKVHARWLYPPKTDTFYRMSGWEELGDSITGILEKYETGRTFAFSDSYHIASELSFYIDGNPQTYAINQGRRMNQFDLWKGIEQFEDSGHTGIYISGSPAPAKLKRSFGELKSHQTYERTYRGEVVQTLHVYVFQNFAGYTSSKPKSY